MVLRKGKIIMAELFIPLTSVEICYFWFGL